MEEHPFRTLPMPMVSRAMTGGERNKYVVELLTNILPRTDLKSVVTEYKKKFALNKFRTKVYCSKPEKKKFLTARKRTILGLNKLTKRTNLKYADALALNELWLGYMKQMLGIDNFTELPQQPIDRHWDLVGQQLLKADFNGAKISVVRSKCPSLVGINGIILQDTKCTFRVLGEDNIIRTIPKDTVMFKIYLEDVSLQLFGKELCVRPTERSVKKFKTVHMADL